MVNRVFIYGEFQSEVSDSGMRGIPPPPRRDDLAPQAIEILREFSPMDLIGKIYVLTQGRNYQPVTPLGVRNFAWYNEYRIASVGTKKPRYLFKVKDGDLWHVLWMRQESDEAGPYMAAALRHD